MSELWVTNDDFQTRKYILIVNCIVVRRGEAVKVERNESGWFFLGPGEFWFY